MCENCFCIKKLCALVLQFSGTVLEFRCGARAILDSKTDNYMENILLRGKNMAVYICIQPQGTLSFINQVDLPY